MSDAVVIDLHEIHSQSRLSDNVSVSNRRLGSLSPLVASTIADWVDLNDDKTRAISTGGGGDGSSHGGDIRIRTSVEGSKNCPDTPNSTGRKNSARFADRHRYGSKDNNDDLPSRCARYQRCSILAWSLFMSCFFSILVGIFAWGLSSQNGRNAVVDASDRFADVVLIRNTQRLENVLRSILGSISLGASFRNPHLIEVQLQRSLIGMLANSMDLELIGIENAAGEMYIVYRKEFFPQDASKNTFYFLKRESNQEPCYYTTINSIDEDWIWKPFEPSSSQNHFFPKPWLEEFSSIENNNGSSETKERITWTKLFSVGIDLPENHVIGKNISRDVRKAASGSFGYRYPLLYMNRTGSFVVASSFSHMLILEAYRENVTPGTSLDSSGYFVMTMDWNGVLSPNPLFSQNAPFYFKRHGVMFHELEKLVLSMDWDSDGALVRSERMKVTGDNLFVKLVKIYVPLRESGIKDAWIGITFVSQTDALKSFEINDTKTLGIIFSVIISCAVLSVLGSICIYRPLKQLQDALSHVALMDLDQPPLVPSRFIQEVGQAQVHFNQLVQNLKMYNDVRISILVLDLDLQVQFANPFFFLSFHIDTVEEAESLLNNLTINHETFSENITSLLTGYYDSFTDEIRIEQPNRLRRILTVSGKYNPLSANITLAMEDVTQQVQHEEDLNDAISKAEAANAAKSEFLSHMTHELRTPLNGVIGMSSIMTDLDLTADQQELMEGIKFSADLLLSLISDILDLSKIEASKVAIEALPIDLRLVVENVVSSTSSAYHHKGFEIISFVDPEVPALLLGDKTRIAQVVNNLMSNACKFTQEGYVAVSVNLVAILDRGARLRFTCVDTGCGVKEEAQRRLFDAFYQVNPNGPQGGTGLGLCITASLVKMMGGRLQLESEWGHGSTFAFDITLKRPDILEKESMSSLLCTDSGNDGTEVKAFGFSDRIESPHSNPKTSLTGLRMLVMTPTMCLFDVIARYAGSTVSSCIWKSTVHDAVTAITNDPISFDVCFLDAATSDVRILNPTPFGDVYWVLLTARRKDIDIPENQVEEFIHATIVKPLRYAQVVDILHSVKMGTSAQNTKPDATENSGVHVSSSTPPVTENMLGTSLVPAASSNNYSNNNSVITIDEASIDVPSVCPIGPDISSTVHSDATNSCNAVSLTTPPASCVEIGAPLVSRNEDTDLSDTVGVPPVVVGQTNKKSLTSNQSKKKKAAEIIPEFPPDLHVLLVEDNSINVKVASSMLNKANIQFVVAENGQEAVTKARSHDFDIILMDLQMPVMDGFAAAAQIRCDTTSAGKPAHAIIAMTADVLKTTVDRCYEVGMNDYFPKPIRKKGLYDVLSKWVRIRKEEREAADAATLPLCTSETNAVTGDLDAVPAPVTSIVLEKSRGRTGISKNLPEDVSNSSMRDISSHSISRDHSPSSVSSTIDVGCERQSSGRMQRHATALISRVKSVKVFSRVKTSRSVAPGLQSSLVEHATTFVESSRQRPQYNTRVTRSLSLPNFLNTDIALLNNVAVTSGDRKTRRLSHVPSHSLELHHNVLLTSHPCGDIPGSPSSSISASMGGADAGVPDGSTVGGTTALGGNKSTSELLVPRSSFNALALHQTRDWSADVIIPAYWGGATPRKISRRQSKKEMREKHSSLSSSKRNSLGVEKLAVPKFTSPRRERTSSTPATPVWLQQQQSQSRVQPQEPTENRRTSSNFELV